MTQEPVEARSRRGRRNPVVIALFLWATLLAACRSSRAPAPVVAPVQPEPVVGARAPGVDAEADRSAPPDIPNGAIVEGVVLEHGKPRAGCAVAISFPPRDWYRSESGRAYFTRTDADGRFRSSVQSGCARFDVLEGGVMHLQVELRCLKPGDHVTGIVLYIGAH